MPRQITKDVTPAEIQQLAEEYQQLLAKSNVPMKLEQTIADMERRAAEMNGMAIDEWKRKFEIAAASEELAEPTAKKKVPGSPGGSSPGVPAGRHGADEHVAVCGVRLHPHAIAKERAAGDRARRIDRDHADGAARRASRRSFFGQRTSCAQPSRSNSEMIRAVLSIWPRSTP